jgi:enoyl-CoA hydratase/carnithine racemase
VPDVAADEPAPGVARVLLNRPDRKNALDAGMSARLLAALSGPLPPVVVLGSAAPAAFCSGADLSLSADDVAAVSETIYDILERLITTDAVVIAAADGPAIGGGAQLLLAADLRIASPRTVVGFVGVASGLAIGTWRLPQVVGPGLAADLALTGRRLSCQEAQQAGLVQRVADDPMAQALAAATMIAAAPGGVPGAAKRLLTDGGLVGALRRERAANRDRRHAQAGSRSRKADGGA